MANKVLPLTTRGLHQRLVHERIGGFLMLEAARSSGPCTSHDVLDPFHDCDLGASHVMNVAAPDISRLTRRELEVLHVIGLGESNRLLARRMGIAERTVKAHVSSIIAKLELRSRGDATALSILRHAEVHGILNLPKSQ
ncbi:response regulator transcription factor [Streptomyces sp. NPDC006463]|uniref:helix-turn-helix transcriptional regulator n=1 Tax=Streptomyces sp. NPDC006463 TaxID=3364746 RepID=UPI0036957247